MYTDQPDPREVGVHVNRGRTTLDRRKSLRHSRSLNSVENSVLSEQCSTLIQSVLCRVLSLINGEHSV